MSGMQMSHGLEMRMVQGMRRVRKLKLYDRTWFSGRWNRGRWLRDGGLSEPIAQDVGDREGDAGGGLLRRLLLKRGLRRIAQWFLLDLQRRDRYH